jgi:hypothetical protein
MSERLDSQASSGLEWFTRSVALAEARARVPNEETRARLRKAQSALELVELGLEPPESFASGDPNDALLLLLAEAFRVALTLRAGLSAEASIAEALASLPSGALASFAPEGAELGALLQHLGEGRADAFTGLAPLDADERLADCRAFVRAVVAEVAKPLEAVANLQRERRNRVLGVFAAALLVVAGGVFTAKRAAEGPDLAGGKPFTASSAYDSFATAGRTNEPVAFDLFAHTVEEEHPWIQIDLGKSERVKKVLVKNRTDCCGERAVPLVVEASVDGSSWTQVARRDEIFTEWNVALAPTELRFLRFSVPRRTFLHLSRVQVWR